MLVTSGDISCFRQSGRGCRDSEVGGTDDGRAGEEMKNKKMSETTNPGVKCQIEYRGGCVCDGGHHAGQRVSSSLTSHHGVALVRRQIPSNSGAGAREAGLGVL